MTTSGHGIGGTSTSGLVEDSASNSAGSAASTDAGADTETKRDLGAQEDFAPDQPVGCKGKVDMLFLISRLHTMKTEQAQLLASFPGFVDTIRERLEGFDLHLMVANPDGEWPGWNCEYSANACPMHFPNCGPNALEYQCIAFPELVTPCDAELGAGLVFNVGSGAANRVCDLYGGNRYIISGEPALDDALECVAKVGYSSGYPPLGDAMVAALGWKLNGKGGCNEGFLRSDALLVVVFIADGYDETSKSFPYQQYNAIVAAKKDPNAVVMLGIIPQPQAEAEPGVPNCTYDDMKGGKLRQLIDMMPYHAHGNTCAHSFAPFFDEAVGLIDEACGNFVPQ